MLIKTLCYIILHKLFILCISFSFLFKIYYFWAICMSWELYFYGTHDFYNSVFLLNILYFGYIFSIMIGTLRHNHNFFAL